MCGDDGWLVFVVESHAGARLWLFWSARVQDWVSDHRRAAQMTGAEADALAERLSAEHGVDARTIRAADVV